MIRFSLPTLFALALSLISIESFAQTFHPDYRDGTLYLRQSDTSTLVLDPYAGNNISLNVIFSTFGVDTIYKAFVTQDTLIDRIFRLHFTDTLGVNNLITQLTLLPFVNWAEKIPINEVIKINYLPDDLDPLQWALPKINALAAWDISQGSPNITIAIVDNAVKTSHWDLTGNIWVNPGETAGNLLDDDLNGFRDDVNGYDVADLDNDPNPPPGITQGSVWSHGSHCAGIASGSTDNGFGIASIGFNCSIMGIKCAPNLTNGAGLTHAYEGIDYAISAEADIISMSFGGNGISVTGQLIIQTANNRGIVLIAAAGNNNENTLFYPAAWPEVFAVGSTNSLDEKSGFSNYGTWVDVMAPGSSIYSLAAESDSSFTTMSGTSMACPLTAGLAGLVLSHNPGLTNSAVKNLISAGCDNIDLINPTLIGQLGSGRINAFATMLATPIEINEGNSKLPPKFILFPNPASRQVELIINDQSKPLNSKLLLMDLLGRELTTPIELKGDYHFVLSLDGISSGIYLVGLEGETGSITWNRLVVKK